MSTTVQQVKNDALRRGLVTLLSTLTAAGGAVKLFTPAVVDRNGTTMARAAGRAVKDTGPVPSLSTPVGEIASILILPFLDFVLRVSDSG